MVEQLAEMLPQLSRAEIEAELRRTGSAQLVVDRALAAQAAAAARHGDAPADEPQAEEQSLRRRALRLPV